MSTNCKGALTDDILFDCEAPSSPGIEVDMTLINREDIDLAATTFDPDNKLLITNLALKTGKTGFLIKGIKQIFAAGHELVVKEDGPNKWKHSFTGAVLSPTVANKSRIQEMSEGASLVAVIETKFKGKDQKDAFQVIGLEQGLELSAATWNSNENSGTLPFELTSVDGYEEPTMIRTLLETDYATTKLAMTNKFAGNV